MKNCYNTFERAFIEYKALEYPLTQKLLPGLKNIVYIDSYKDIFLRKNQDYALQAAAGKALILGVKESDTPSVYKGADKCQDFGFDHFYYDVCVMNCIYDCKYCFLKGMYRSANVLVFVNIEDIFKEVKDLLEREGKVYLCVSYESDLLALENYLGFAEKWVEFVHNTPGLTIEIRTKAANTDIFNRVNPNPNVIFAWTLTPDEIALDVEKKAPSLKARFRAMEYAAAKGFTVRGCFDPMVPYAPDPSRTLDLYKKTVKELFDRIPPEKIRDISIGTFRISDEYRKNFVKTCPGYRSLLFDEDTGKSISSDLRDFLHNYVSWDKIYIS